MALQLKLTCDKCGQEISPNTPIIFVGKKYEIKTSIPTKEFLKPFQLPQRNQPIFLEQVVEHKLHLCPSCTVKFEEFLKKG